MSGVALTAADPLPVTRQPKASRSHMVLAAFTMLYVINIVETAVQWRSLQAFLELDGEKTEVFFRFAIEGFGWQDVVGNVMNFMLSPIADGLLVSGRYLRYALCLRSARFCTAINCGITQSGSWCLLWCCF